MKKILLWLVCLSMLGIFAVPVSAAAKGITLSKSIYLLGEKITVYYEGTTSKDWVGVYNKGDIPSGSVNSKDWKYADGGSGAIQFDNTYSEGEYEIILLENDGYTILGREVFKIESIGETDLNMEKTIFQEGEDIRAIYSASSGDGWIGIYQRGILPKDEDGYKSLKWMWTRDIGQPDGTAIFENDLKVGEYDMILFKDSGYNIIKRIPFDVIKAIRTIPCAPEKVEYKRTAERLGYADGTVTITAPTDQSNVTAYALYWGNESGKITGYSCIPVSKSSGIITTYNTVKNTMIPPGAIKLLVYSVNVDTLSDDFVEVILPEGVAMPEKTPLFSFSVVSDTHITGNASHIHNQHFDMMLKDFKETYTKSSALIIVGDMTDNGLQNQYDQLKSIIESNNNLPPIYYAIGNHEYQNDSLSVSQTIELFKKNTDMPSLYFDKKINGSYFIFLGSEAKGLYAEIGKDQFTWLENKLKEASESNPSGPIYLFLHQSLKNTVSGSLPGQGWNGVNQDEKLRSLLDKYPQVIMFSGHSHWELDSKDPMFDGKNKGATFFNTASVGYLWTDEQQGKEGSQGYYVEVFEDKLLVRGRDFVSGEWVSGAQFIVDLSEKIATENDRELDNGDTDPGNKEPGNNDNSDRPNDKDQDIDHSPQTGDGLALYIFTLTALLSASIIIIKRKLT